jgi:hypothetical protein
MNEDEKEAAMNEPKINVPNDGVLVERFSPSDLTTLRNELLQSGVDSFQAAQMVTNFLSGRGYGVSSQEARTAASKIEGAGCTAEHIQAELERVARVM